MLTTWTINLKKVLWQSHEKSKRRSAWTNNHPNEKNLANWAHPEKKSLSPHQKPKNTRNANANFKTQNERFA